jgi:hypothetical protein
VHADQNASTRQSFASAYVPDVQSSAKKRPGNRTRPTKN